MNEHVLRLAVIDPERLLVRGMEDQPHFVESILEQGGVLDSDLIGSSSGDSIRNPYRLRARTPATLIDYLRAQTRPLVDRTREA